MSDLELETVHYIEAGTIDIPALLRNLDAIAAAISENKTAVETELATLKRSVTTKSQTCLIDYSDHSERKTLIPAKAHLKMQLDNAFLIIADNHDRESNIYLQKGNHEEKLTEPLKIKHSEKAGKARPLSVIPRREIGSWDSVEVVSDLSRRVVVVANFAEVD